MKKALKHLNAFAVSTGVSVTSCLPPLSTVAGGSETTSTQYALPATTNIPSLADLGDLEVTDNGSAIAEGTAGNTYTISADRKYITFNTARTNGHTILRTQRLVHRLDPQPDKKATLQVVWITGTFTAVTLKVEGRISDDAPWVAILTKTEADFSSGTAGAYYISAFDGFPVMRVSISGVTTSVAGTISAWIEG